MDDNILFPSKKDGSVHEEPDDMVARVYGAIGSLPQRRSRMPFRGLPVYRVTEPLLEGRSVLVPNQADGQVVPVADTASGSSSLSSVI